MGRFWKTYSNLSRLPILIVFKPPIMDKAATSRTLYLLISVCFFFTTYLKLKPKRALRVLVQSSGSWTIHWKHKFALSLIYYVTKNKPKGIINYSKMGTETAWSTRKTRSLSIYKVTKVWVIIIIITIIVWLMITTTFAVSVKHNHCRSSSDQWYSNNRNLWGEKTKIRGILQVSYRH